MLRSEANYESAQGGNTFLATAYNTLFTSFDNAYGVGTETGIVSSSTTFNNALAGVDMAGKNSSSTAPRAFLNYIFFDREMNYVSAGFQQISRDCLGIFNGINRSEKVSEVIFAHAFSHSTIEHFAI